MKKLFFFVLIFLLISGNVMFAQPSQSIENTMARLQSKLELTPEQTQQIRTILVNAEQEAQQLQEMNRGNREAILAAWQDQEERVHQQIRNILNPDQQKKFEEIKSSLVWRRMNFDKEVQRLKDRLHLNEEQALQVQKIIEKTRTEMQNVRARYSGDRYQMRNEMMKIIQERDKEIEALLTPEQRKEYEKYKSERQQMMPGRGGRRGGGMMRNW